MKRVDDRRATRYEADGKVHLKLVFTRNSDINEIRGRVLNVSRTGLCFDPEHPVDVGALADLNIELSGQPLANTLGLIRWVDEERGVGLEFFYGTEEEREALESYFKTWAREHHDVVLD